MSSYNKGGRGNRNPYNSVIMRVPEPLVNKFEEIIETYRQAVIEGMTTQVDRNELLTKSLEKVSLPTKSEAIKKAKAILRQRKSAKVSVLKLLQVLIDEGITQDDLK